MTNTMTETITTNETYEKEIACEILNQLGGKRFQLFTGCDNFLCGTDKNTGKVYLHMRIPHNASKANRLTIYYNEGLDLYEMRFFQFKNGSYNIRTGKFTADTNKTVAEYEQVYADMLADLFTDVTKMVTHF